MIARRISFPLLVLAAVLALPAESEARQDLDLSKFRKAVERLAERVQPALVGVEAIEKFSMAPGGEGGTTGATRGEKLLLRCSGVVLSREGEVVTLFPEGLPEVEDGSRLEFVVTLHDDSELAAEVAATDPETGVTLLRLKGAPKLKPVRVAHEARLEADSLVIALGKFHPPQWGKVRSSDRGVRTRQFFFPRTIRTDLFALPGDVGGMLLDSSGAMVGLLAFADPGDQGFRFGEDRGGAHASRSPLGSETEGEAGESGAAEAAPPQGRICAIPSDLLGRIVTELRSEGTVRRGYLGVRLEFVEVEPRFLQHNLWGRAARVTQIEKGGPAERAGIEVGQFITRYDGKRLDSRPSFDQLIETVLYQSRPKHPLNLQVFDPEGCRYRTLSIQVDFTDTAKPSP